MSLLGYPHECDNVLDAGEEAGEEKDWGAECRSIFESRLDAEQLLSADVILFNERWVPGDHASLAEAISRVREVNPSAHIAVVGPKHQFEREPVDILNEQEPGLDVNIIAARYLRDRTAINDEMRASVQTMGASYIDIYAIMCPPGPCEMAYNGELTYFDNQHWTAVGATLYGARLLSSPSYNELLAAPAEEGPSVMPPAEVQAPVHTAGSAQLTSEEESVPVNPVRLAAPTEVEPPTEAPANPVIPFWLPPENVEVSAATGPSGAREGTTVFVAGGHHRVRYEIPHIKNETLLIRWPVKFGSNNRFIVFVYSPDGVYGSLRIERDGKNVNVVTQGGDVSAVSVLSLDDDWTEISFQLKARELDQGTQLILYPTPEHVYEGGESFTFGVADPDVAREYP